MQTNSSIKVSVIISFYNQASFIAETIQSVLNQTHKNLEILLRDDGSTDDGAQRVALFKDPRIKFTHGPNIGPGASCQELINLASGEFVAFLAGDDVFLPTKIRSHLDAVNDGQSFSYGAVSFIDEASKGIKTPKRFAHLFQAGPPEAASFFRQLFFDGNIVQASTVLAPTKIIKDVGGLRSGLIQLQDYDLWMKLSQKLTPHFVSEPLTQYRILKKMGNLGADNQASRRRRVFEENLIFEEVLSHFDEHHFFKTFPEMKGFKKSRKLLEGKILLEKHRSPAARLVGLKKVTEAFEANPGVEITFKELMGMSSAVDLFMDARALSKGTLKAVNVLESLRHSISQLRS